MHILIIFALTHLTTVSFASLTPQKDTRIATNISLRRDFNNIRTTVSGLSAGAFFAHQYHVAHSASVHGAGIIAGGPYYCALGNLITAQTSCMKDPSLISVDVLIDIVDRTYKTTKTIDAPENLASDRVFLFSGKNDSVVVQGVMTKLEIFYGRLVLEPGNIMGEFDVEAEHSLPTNNYGNPCTYLGEPYVNDCDYDAAYKILKHLIFHNMSMKPRAHFNESNLIEFDQSKYVPIGTVPREISLDKIGYAYVPTRCRRTHNNSECLNLHIVFHGCLQGRERIDAEFVRHSGYNEYAESNSIIIVYPQVISTALNPKGCFDWWGYTGPAYASKLGPQMEFVSSIQKNFLSCSIFHQC